MKIIDNNFRFNIILRIKNYEHFSFKFDPFTQEEYLEINIRALSFLTTLFE